MTFLDDLPDECPPADHDTGTLSGVYRMLEGSKPCDRDWLSYAKLGKPCPSGVSLCRAASLSLMPNRPAVEKLLKLPNFKNVTHAAVLNIPSDRGAHITNKNHIDFWQDAAANMNDFVTAIERVRSA